MSFALLSDPPDRPFQAATPGFGSEPGTLETMAMWGRDLVRAPYDAAVTEQRLGAVFDASERSRRLVETMEARHSGFRAWYDEVSTRAAQVGVRLSDPTPRLSLAVGDSSTMAGFDGAFGGAMPDPLDPASRVAALRSQLDELARTHPGRFDDLMNPDAYVRRNALAADRDNREQGERQDVNRWLWLGATLGGAVWGSREDPVSVGSMLFLPVGGAGPTALARIANAALVQGLGSAGAEAVAQPFVQGWRAELGLEAGLREGLTNVAAAGAFGAALGGAVKGVGEAVSRIRSGRGTAADVETVAAARGQPLDDDTRAALKLAEEVDADDRTLMARPQGVPEEVAGDQVAAAVRLSSDPAAPLPVLSRVLPDGVDGRIAERALDEAPSMDGFVRQLRDDPDLLASAHASSSYVARDLAAVAALGDDAFQRVMSGELDISHAAAIGHRTFDPAEQARLADMLARDPSATLAEAVERVSDAIKVNRAEAVALAQLGVPRIDAGAEQMRLAEARARYDVRTYADPGDPRGQVALANAEGQLVLADRNMIGAVGERDRWLETVVKACRT